MIDLIIAYLSLIVVILLFIIASLTLYIIHERRKTTLVPLNKDKRIVIPLLTLKTNDRSSGDHSNSATLTATRKRMTKRLRHRVKIYFSINNFEMFSFLATDIIYPHTKLSRFSPIKS